MYSYNIKSLAADIMCVCMCVFVRDVCGKYYQIINITISAGPIQINLTSLVLWSRK